MAMPRRVGTTRTRDPRGYVVLIYEDGAKEYEHRAVARERLGRLLLPGEVVHHVNGVKDDNRWENLEVATNADHASHHAPDRHKRGWSRHYAACEGCGTTEREHHANGRCGRCYRRPSSRS